ncbi:MAG: D-ribose pyranase [Firmicutes bacterium]|nr:D-ribose pyranase [Bacillota bacterium]
MKKIGTLNQPLSSIIAGMGHGDMLVIADCGLPIPPEVMRLDLALTSGVPGFLETLAVVQQELQVESVIIANEMVENSLELYKKIQPMIGNITIEMISHDEFKELSQQAVAVVRTGECTPYANIILKSGVIF